MFAFVVCFICGCVTVTEQEAGKKIDRIKLADARISLGLGYLYAGNWLKARENLELALNYAPNYYRSLNSIAYYYQQVGETDLADRNYKKALRQSPKNGDVLNNFGVFLCKLGKYEHADELFNRAIKQPHYYQVSDSYENAALCSLKSDNKNKAANYFRRSLDYDPNRYVALFQLSKLDIEAENYDIARIRLLKIHKKFGYQASSLELLIETEEKAGNKQLAKKYASILDTEFPDFNKY